jgi:hypothetical protein
MAYNSNNHNKFVQKAINVYKLFENSDRPDTYIVRKEFPKFGIHITYRTWMNFKKKIAA